MLSKKFLNKIRRDLKPLQKYNVVIYGSALTSRFSRRSDIDIAIITESKEREYNKKVWAEAMKFSWKEYDIKVFELLPLWLKMEIIENHLVLFGDEKKISEYFYFYRKIWKDMKSKVESNRFKSIEEIRRGINNLKKLRSLINGEKATF